MSDYKDFLGYLATLVAFGSYAIYFWSIFTGKTKPHAFTWFVWGTLNAIAFAAVTVAGGDKGAWVLAVNVLACYAIAGIAFFQGRVVYDRFDWLALLGALIGMLLWWRTSNPLYAVILVSISDTVGFVPSFRKAYHLPFEENATSFAVGLTYYILAIFALKSLTLTTWLYPAAIILLDSAFVFQILIRRKQLSTR